MKAFPNTITAGTTIGYQQEGMDLRDYFAAKAMQSLIQDEAMKKVIQENHLPTSPYLHLTEYNDVAGIINSGGAWKIQVGKSDD